MLDLRPDAPAVTVYEICKFSEYGHGEGYSILALTRSLNHHSTNKRGVVRV
jgi:hypothetical protein